VRHASKRERAPGEDSALSAKGEAVILAGGETIFVASGGMIGFCGAIISPRYKSPATEQRKIMLIARRDVGDVGQ
jgi:hypothetical protein